MEEFIAPPRPPFNPEDLDFGDQSEMWPTTIHNGGDASLSLLTGEVLQAQKCQVSELESKAQRLESLQIEVADNQKSYEMLSGEVASMNRQIFLLQEDLIQSRKVCSSLEQEIKVILADRKSLQVNLTNSKWNALAERKSLQKYREKMVAHRRSFETYLQNSEQYSEVQASKEQIKELKRLHSSFSLDDIKAECGKLDSSVSDFNEVKAKISTDSKAMKDQLEKENKNLLVMKKEWEALQKRDVSLVNRLNRQLLDGEGQNNTLRQQTRELRDQLRRKY